MAPCDSAALSCAMAFPCQTSWNRILIQSVPEWVDGNDALLQRAAVAPKPSRSRNRNESARLHLLHLVRIRAAQFLGNHNDISPSPSLAPRRACPNPSGGSFVSEIVSVVLRTSARRERVLFHALWIKPIGSAEAFQFGRMMASEIEGNRYRQERKE